MKLPSTIGVTGVAGFIGANLSERLLAEGCAVVGVDDMSAGSVRNLGRFLDDPDFRMHEFDCRDARALRREFARLRRDRPPRRDEDPALRRSAEDAGGQRRRLRTPCSTSALAPAPTW